MTVTVAITVAVAMAVTMAESMRACHEDLKLAGGSP